MQTTIVKWGNSHGIRIPKAFLQSVRLTENDSVDVKLEDGKIIILKQSVVKHKTTKERLAEFYGKEITRNDVSREEIDWGRPVGNELW